MPFVLDNSVVSGWFIEDQAMPYSSHIAARLRSDRAHVPALWELEFTNVLRTACLRSKVGVAHAQAVIAQMARLPIEVDRQGAPPRELLGLAMRFGLTAYDAAYLELALRLACPIATQDVPLRDAALASGVGWVAAEV